MVYKNFQDLKLSALGFGAMRLPVVGNTPDSPIDEVRTAEMVDYAIRHGVNYFDTAYGYHDGKSEIVMGKVLSAYPRDSFYLATKFPGYDLSNMGKVEEIFEEQLKKCGVDYFDFYLAHGLNANNFQVFEAAGCYEVLKRKKKEGKIRHLGFSFHDNIQALEQILEAHPWEFVQIQLNYVDWQSTNAKKQYEMVCAKGLPILVMEPVRGGALANLTAPAKELLQKAAPQASIASWAIRYAASLPGVMTVLSGMSNLDQVEDNIKTMKKFQPLSGQELALLEQVAQIFRAAGAIPCTGCRYCMDCPAGVDIPRVFAAYNHYQNTSQKNQFKNIYRTLLATQRADCCVACGACKLQCPQAIDIPAQMKYIAEFAVDIM